MVRFSLHQSIALWWLFCSGWVFGPVLAVAKAEDAGAIIGYGVTIVAVMTMGVPLLLRSPRFKRWFCWTDAMSADQRRALEQRELQRYYRLAFENGYTNRLVPYLWRILTLLVLGMAVEYELGQRAETPLAKAASVFLSWYPMGAAVVALASAPIIRIIQQRFRQSA